MSGDESKAIAEKDVDPNVGVGVDRDKLEDADFAWPETRSYPIAKPGDVSDAAASMGRLKDGKATDEERATLKANIIRIAKRKGEAFVKELPQAWKGEESAEESADDGALIGYHAPTGEAMRRAKYDQLKAADVPEAKRLAWDAEMAKLDALFEVGRRHSQADVDLIDKIIGLLQELRRNEAAEPLPATEAVKVPDQDMGGEGGDVKAADGKKPPMAFCPKCGKKMQMMDAKDAKVAGRPAMQGKCEKGHPVSMFVETEESARTCYVSEAILLTEATAVLDEAAHEVELTLIKPGWSQNDRYYSPDVLKPAAKLFEGCKAFADHPAKSQEADRPERSVRDIVGYYPKVWAGDDGSIKGRLRVIGEAVQWLWPMILETVKNGAGLVFTSINALGKVKPGEIEGRKGMVVEGIVKANSADVVTQAAAGGQFERLLASDGGFTTDLLAALGYEEWMAARPDFAVRLKEEMKTARKEELVESVRVENDGLKAKVAEAEAAQATLQGKVGELEKERGGFDAKIRGADEAKGKALAELRQQMAAREAAHRAEVFILKANVPDVIVEAVRPLVVAALAKGDEAAAREAVETERARLRKAVGAEAKVEAKGGGQQAGVLEGANPVAGVLGVDVVPREGETAAEYGERKRRLREARAVKAAA